MIYSRTTLELANEEWVPQPIHPGDEPDCEASFYFFKCMRSSLAISALICGGKYPTTADQIKIALVGRSAIRDVMAYSVI